MARTAKGVELVEQAQRVILSRNAEAEALELSGEFLDGFAEGVAEFLAVLLGEPATDLLEEITDSEIERCRDCGALVIFESTSAHPGIREYDVCGDCGNHVCPDCVVMVGESPFCKKCKP